MDLQAINTIVNDTSLDCDKKEQLILEVIAKDEKAVPYILKILHFERTKLKLCLRDTNYELSRITVFASQKKRKWFGSGFSFEFIVKELKKLYGQYENLISPLYNEEQNIFIKYDK